MCSIENFVCACVRTVHIPHIVCIRDPIHTEAESTGLPLIALELECQGMEID